jgi:kynurenine formamidase
MADRLDEFCQRYRNWGRWGTDDELGTTNFITPSKILSALKLPTRGAVFCLALPYDSNGPQTGHFNRINPFHQMVATGTDHIAGNQVFMGKPFPRGFGYSDDTIFMPLQSGTQWDGLSHIFHNGKMYNGYDASLVSALGATKNGIEKLASRVVTRGVLLDVARYKKVESLEPGYAITMDDLEGTAKRQSVEIEQGDAVLVRTGHLGRCRREGSWGTYAAGDAPGLSFATAPWLYDNSISAIASDTWGVEVRPNELPDSFQPLHLVMVVNMGLLVGEIFYLEELADDCAADGVYEFLLVAPPLPITAAVGSPLAPLAIK